MNDHLRTPLRPARGFTLLELLMVLGIIVLLAGVGIPTFNSLIRGMRLSQTSQILADQMALARQLALSTNRQVEVRLYKFKDPQVSAGEDRVHALQLFEAPDSVTTFTNVSQASDSLGYRALGKVIRLGGSTIIIDSGKTLSTLIGNASGGTAVPTLTSGSLLGYSLPIVGTNYSAIRFSFMPDGSTNLPPQTSQLQWFLTVHEAIKGDNLSTPPSNFATIQIQPSNGKLRTYHP